MECMRDTVLLRDCSSTMPASGIYLNTLAGISNLLLEKSANEEQANYLSVFNDVQDRSILQFRTDIIGKLREHWEFKDVYCIQEVGYLLDGDSIIATSPTSEFQGFYLEVPR